MDWTQHCAARRKAHTAFAERVGDAGRGENFRGRQTPRFVRQFRKFDFASACPPVRQSSHDDSAIVEQDFHIDVILNRRRDATDDEIDISFAQFPILLCNCRH